MVTVLASGTPSAGLPTLKGQRTRRASRHAAGDCSPRPPTPFAPALRFPCSARARPVPLQRGARATAAAGQSSATTAEPATNDIFLDRDIFRDEEPADARSAIALGLRLYEDNQFELALDLFSRALTLPGTGLKRFRDKPNEASDAERISMLYNSACCLSQLGRQMEGLKVLAAAFEAGFEDIPQIQRDPDLETLREHPAFEGLLARFEKPKGLISDFLSGFRS